MSHRPAVYHPAKQHGTSQAAPVRAVRHNHHPARAQWPGRRGTRHSGFARRKKQTAKGAQPKTAFWFLCRRGQRNPPPERRNPLLKSSRRSWSGNGGPVWTPAPTPNLWFFAGGWYPPLRTDLSSKHKNVGATGMVTPTFCVQNGRRSETEFRRKFFAKLSFKKAGRRGETEFRTKLF